MELPGRLGGAVGTSTKVIAPVFDPLWHNVELPLRSVLYPFGYPVELSTDSSDVALSALESWGGCPQFFQEPPLEIRVAVDRQSPDAHAEGLRWRAQGHLVAMISDARNFATCDLDRRFAFCWVTEATARDRPWLRAFYLNTIVNLLLWNSHFTGIHAGCVALDGRGLLLCGRSGAGKSCLTYACVRRGWTFVSDESPVLVRRPPGRTVIGKPRQIHLRETAFELFPELKGRPTAPNPVGKISFELDLADAPGVKTAHRCEIGAVIFLNRDGEKRARLVRLAPEEAHERLTADLPVYLEPAFTEHKASLRTLVEGGAFELRYGDADSAVDELEHMIRDGGPR
jgi:hypothetical protein